MPSYVIIEIDRTPPKLDIYAPRYTTNEITNRIVIESNENLSKNHKVYIVDGQGNRHEYTFNRESSREYVGYLIFRNFNQGVVTLYAQIEDEVGNLSNLESFSIEIKENLSSLSVSINDYNRIIAVRDKGSKADTYIKDSQNYTKDSYLFDNSVHSKETGINVSDEIIS